MKEKAQVWIYSRTPDGSFRILLLKVKPERGDFWQPVTGHVDEGETIEAGALREAFEESGLEPIGPLTAIGYDFKFDGKWGKAHETAFSLEVAKNCPTPKLDPNEHNDYQWLEPKKAMSLLTHESNSHALALLLKKF